MEEGKGMEGSELVMSDKAPSMDLGGFLGGLRRGFLIVTFDRSI